MSVVLSVVVTTVAVLILMRGELVRQAETLQTVKMSAFRELLDQKGPAKIVDGKLHFGAYVANNDYEVVDKLKALAGGTATIFQGDIRVSTNVLKDDGSRAVGTPLVGAAKDATIGRGQGYRGEADILGVPYFTSYEPILDGDGRTIGVLYVGVKQDEFFRSFRVLMMIAAGVALIMLVFFGAIVSMTTGRMLQRLLGLAHAADAISMGDELETPLKIETKDEIGTLTKSIDRLRESMREALRRLSA